MTRQLDAPLKHLSLSPYHRTAVDLYYQIKAGKILMDPPYQRGSVWTEDQRLDLMYSFLSGYPVGTIIVNDRMRQVWGHKVSYAVIDGRQRLEAICAWFDGQLRIPASWIERRFIASHQQLNDGGDGDYVDITNLSELGAAKIESAMSIQQYVAQVDSLEAEKEIYRLVNKGGTPHTEEDLARADANPK